PDSSMALVSSSTNSGTPSVLSRICSSRSSGSALPPVSPATSAAPRLRLSRLSVSAVRCGWPGQGATNSGRKVTSTRTGRRGGRHVGRAAGEQRLEPVELPRRRLVTGEAGGVLEQVDDRVQGAGLVEGRAEMAERRVGLVRQPLAQGADEPRLADPRLAGEQ